MLVTGRGTSGSWTIRGVELGGAIGATVQVDARDVAAFDLAVVVKRCPQSLLDRLRAVPVVWDTVDPWPQPEGNDWDRDGCMAWLRQEVKRIRPVGIVAATRAMAVDCAQFGLPVLALPHHAQPGRPVNPIRPKVRSVGYQGGVGYLGRWAQFLDTECVRRGWQFVVNPPSLSEVEIVVAVRNQTGYGPRHWKSNVKLANAQASGTPFIGNREAGCLECASGFECWADDEQEMRLALDSLEPQDIRLAVSAGLIRSAPLLPAVAKEYAAWLSRWNC